MGLRHLGRGYGGGGDTNAAHGQQIDNRVPAKTVRLTLDQVPKKRLCSTVTSPFSSSSSRHIEYIRLEIEGIVRQAPLENKFGTRVRVQRPRADMRREEDDPEDDPIERVNAMERQIYRSEERPSGIRWKQARLVAAALDAGITARELAPGCINSETGKAYSQAHIRRVAAAWNAFGYLGAQRPRWNVAYNSPEVREQSRGV